MHIQILLIIYGKHGLCARKPKILYLRTDLVEEGMEIPKSGMERLAGYKRHLKAVISAKESL